MTNIELGLSSQIYDFDATMEIIKLERERERERMVY